MATAPRNEGPEKIVYHRWQAKLSHLIYYRSGYREIPKLKRGGVLGYVSNRGKLDAFNFGEFDDGKMWRIYTLSRTRQNVIHD